MTGGLIRLVVAETGRPSPGRGRPRASRRGTTGEGAAGRQAEQGGAERGSTPTDERAAGRGSTISEERAAERGSTATEEGRPSAPSPGDGSVTLQWTSRWAGDGPGPAVVGTDGEADLILSLVPEDAKAILEGRLTPSVAYMQGRLKTSGDNELLLKVLKWTAGPGFEKALREWRVQFGGLG
jgi:hypothetical protein